MYLAGACHRSSIEKFVRGANPPDRGFPSLRPQYVDLLALDTLCWLPRGFECLRHAYALTRVGQRLSQTFGDVSEQFRPS